MDEPSKNDEPVTDPSSAVGGCLFLVVVVMLIAFVINGVSGGEDEPSGPTGGTRSWTSQDGDVCSETYDYAADLVSSIACIDPDTNLLTTTRRYRDGTEKTDISDASALLGKG